MGNGNTSFSVTAGGSLPFSYQWTLNTTNLPAATNATLLLTNVQFSQAGNYAVLVTNLFGFTNSADAVLTVNDRLDHFLWGLISVAALRDEFAFCRRDFRRRIPSIRCSPISTAPWC